VSDFIPATAPASRPSPEWHAQWARFQDDEEFLFSDWIRPNTLADFAGCDILEAGCGGGQHTRMMSAVAASVTAVDLNTADIARARNADRTNVLFVTDDLATMDLGRQFDVVICIGVIHHTDDPDVTFANLYRHCRPGGRMVIWTYSAEGNGLVRYLVEPVRKSVLRYLPRTVVVWLSWLLTLILYPLIYTVYLLPVARALPYYEYFQNARRMSLRRNVLNVFDKLNAPQTHFTTRAKCGQWFSPARFEPASISVLPYAGVSYSLSGIKRSA
jgi:SAM-dependent methyltransferase